MPNMFTDPTEWVIEHYPWTDSSEWSDHLNRLRVEDIDTITPTSEHQQAVNNLAENIEKFEINTDGSESNNDVNQIKDPFVSLHFGFF